MSIFSFIKKKETNNSLMQTPLSQTAPTTRSANLANLVLNSIDEGVMIVHSSGIVVLINPAAMRLLGTSDPNTVENLQLASILKLENGEGLKIDDNVNPVLRAVMNGENYNTRDLVLVSIQEQRKPVAISVVCTTAGQNERIITLRDIARELEEEGEQAEFISTASHEMRTPVASIEGYLGLALNPKTATIDDRARKYLEEAHASSKHLGRLFKDLLDVTKLDDKKIRVQLSPVEMSSTVRSIANGQVPMMNEKGIHYTFGASSARSGNTARTINQEVYASVDIDFLREVVSNLVENAIKYTASGGGIWINVRGDGDRVLINVTDTGIGISPDDLKHIFQKFYRADNSQTRTVGGTGLGLYLVKQRVEAMGGKVWAESSFGEGSTFYLSFPRITAEEYQRRKQIASNIEAMNINSVNNNTLNQPNDVTPTSFETPTTQDPQANQVVPGVQTTQLAPTAPEIKTTQVAPESSISSTAPINPIASQPVIQQQYQPIAQPTYATQAVQTGQPQAIQAPMMQPQNAQPQPGQIPIVQPQIIQPQTMQPQLTQPTVLQQSVNNNQKLPTNN
jgi:two-component sensor kinase, probably involved in phosphate sensing